ncbi:MAG: hypothetical protein AAFN70_10195, partial [Planctomycetota bacterium]
MSQKRSDAKQGINHDTNQRGKGTTLMAAATHWWNDWISGWDGFFFTPSHPQTLATIRIATAAMLLYTHVIVAANLSSFLGQDAWISNELAQDLNGGRYMPPGMSESAAGTYLSGIDSPAVLMLHQAFTILVTLCFMLGLGTRITAPLAWFLQLQYMHRMVGALFGLDQITSMLAMYLMLSNCGAVWSIDAFLQRRFADHPMAKSAWFA